MLLIRLLLLLTLSNPSIAFAATEFISYINCGTSTCSGSGEEDYGSISTWESATDENLTNGTRKCGSWDTKVNSTIADGNAITWGAGTGFLIHQSDHAGTSLDQYMINVTSGTLSDDDVITSGSNTFTINGSPDSCVVIAYVYDDDGDITSQANISGATTNSTNYRKITVPPGERHDGTGTGTTGARVNDTSNGTYSDTFWLHENYIILEWLRIRRNSTEYENRHVIGMQNDSARYVTIRNNVFEKSINAHGSYYFQGIYYSGNTGGSGGPIYIYNNIFNRIESSCINSGPGWTPDPNVYVFNNTGYNCSMDTWGSYSSRCEIKNSYASGIGTWGTEVTTGTEDTSGTTGLTNLTASNQFVSLTSDAENLQLKSGADLIDTGTDLGSTYQTDIAGNIRSGTWDVGAHEYQSAGTPRRVMLISKIEDAVCFDNDWYAPQEAGKCKIGNVWYPKSELDLSMTTK